MTDHSLIFALSVLLTGAIGADEVPVSVKEGESVNLPIKPNETQSAFVLLWFFNDEEKFIARMDRSPPTISIPGNSDERFRNRLKMDSQTASLTISDVRRTDTGLYKLEIIGSLGNQFKTFNVTVSAVAESSQRSHWMITGPVLAGVLLLVLVVVSLIMYKRSRKQ